MKIPYYFAPENDPTWDMTFTSHQNGKTGHAELVKVVFEKQQNIFKKVLKVFFENHDPTQGMRQGNDIGTQYRSCIYTNNDVYHDLSISLLKEYQDTLEKNNFNKLITTEIKMKERFFNAEDYHQQYLAKNPQGYCGIQGLGLNLDI